MEKMQRLKDKIVLITGGAQGLGEELALRVVDEGAKIVITDINIKGAQAVADRLNMIALRCDVTKYEECKATVETTKEKFGRIDVLISNAAIWISGSVEEFNPEEWKKVINVNLCGSFNIMKAIAPIMKQQGKGSIIQINSKSGKKGSFKSSAYPASKFGGIGLIQSLALELAPYQIRVNAICPGNIFESPMWTQTMFKKLAKDKRVTEEYIRKKYIDLIPLKRSCSYEDVANILVFLASDESTYMTGQAINVTGGQEMR